MRRAITLIGAALVALSLFAGCADSGYHYVKSSSDRTYFKVPSKWTLFEEEEILDAKEMTDAQRDAELDQNWQVGFDAAPKPSIRHVRSSATPYPSGLAEVHQLSFDESDSVSTGGLRNYFYPVDEALQNDAGELVEYEDLQLDGGFRGIHLVGRFLTSSGDITVLDQTVLVDQSTSKVYALLVKCSDLCYEQHDGDIKKVVDSWTVRAK